MLCFLSSCDDNARNIAIEDQNIEYSGTFVMSLYVPEADIEQLCCDSVPGILTANFATDGFMQLNPTFSERIKFSVPYLDANGNVLPRYKDGFLAKLYNNIKLAASNGKLPMDDFDKLRNELDTIHDNLLLKEIKTTRMPWVLSGASAITVDEEQNSTFAKFDVLEVGYERESNLVTALADIQSYLKTWYDANLITPEDVATLKAINEQRAKTIYDGWGWANVNYANFRISAEMNIHQATGLLDVLSIALYGKNAEGKPSKELWFVVQYAGGIEQAMNGEYVVLEE